LQLFGLSIRRAPYLHERMFPQLRERLGTALDLVVEFSTLGEYTLGAHHATQPAGAPAGPSETHAQQLGGADPRVAQAAARRTVAGGTAASRGNALATPAATPAARRPAVEAAPHGHQGPALPGSGPSPARAASPAAHAHDGAERLPRRRRRTRAGAPEPPIQPCRIAPRS
jgi:hypothetical protein